MTRKEMMEEQMRKIERAVKIDKSRIFNMQLPPVIAYFMGESNVGLHFGMFRFVIEHMTTDE